ncbi:MULTISPECIES: DUF2057 family protein [unclassified Psychrobacter]|uniref:DUF2057 family protein n=1 Tax=unclassified Psychrobacter TaxID=196806 RepID=UPI0025B5E23E|nr:MULTISPECIES: DUF2057 family protein [unclassified Psychrobacter]MDN3453635.1 DUF2057 family protein [Psychrobacter sp. APC 3350]MDN3502025.1 DUF2057 family protein [Psychrobacter sp. 5A.1]
MKSNASLLKKLTIGTLLVGATSIPMLSQAAVTLLIDDHIKVTAINGQEVQQSAFQPLTKKFTLQPGQHAITAKYDRLYNLRRDEHDYLRSGNVSVAAELADNQTYRLTMPNQPEEYEAAREYAKQPTLAVQQNNTIIASQQSMAGNQGGLFAGLGKTLGGVFGGSGDAELQNQRAIAALNQPTAPAQNVSQQNTNIDKSSSTLDQFMQIWLQATPDEREKMSQWIQK